MYTFLPINVYSLSQYKITPLKSLQECIITVYLMISQWYNPVTFINKSMLILQEGYSINPLIWGPLRSFWLWSKIPRTRLQRAETLILFGSTKKCLKSLNYLNIILIYGTFSTKYINSKLLACLQPDFPYQIIQQLLSHWKPHTLT